MPNEAVIEEINSPNPRWSRYARVYLTDDDVDGKYIYASGNVGGSFDALFDHNCQEMIRGLWQTLGESVPVRDGQSNYEVPPTATVFAEAAWRTEEQTPPSPPE